MLGLWVFGGAGWVKVSWQVQDCVLAAMHDHCNLEGVGAQVGMFDEMVWSDCSEEVKALAF